MQYSVDERILRVKKLVKSKQYRLSSHAEKEREADHITKNELEEGLLSDSFEIIEDYPDDKRGPSFLALGFTQEVLPIHYVLTLAVNDILFVITMYRPDPEQWVDYKVRKR